MAAWTNWKAFPDPKHGAPVAAPAGPGVFEVRRISTGDLVAFDHSANVARALGSLAAAGSRPRLFARHRIDAGDLEYRVWPAATSMDAKSIAARLNSQRRVFWEQALQI